MDGGPGVGAGQPVQGHPVVRFYGKGSKKAAQDYCEDHGWTWWFAMDGWSRLKQESFKVLGPPAGPLKSDCPLGPLRRPEHRCLLEVHAVLAPGAEALLRDYSTD